MSKSSKVTCVLWFDLFYFFHLETEIGKVTSWNNCIIQMIDPLPQAPPDLVKEKSIFRHNCLHSIWGKMSFYSDKSPEFTESGFSRHPHHQHLKEPCVGLFVYSSFWFPASLRWAHFSQTKWQQVLWAILKMMLFLNTPSTFQLCLQKSPNSSLTLGDNICQLVFNSS